MCNLYYEIVSVQNDMDILNQKTFPTIIIPTFCYVKAIDVMFEYDFCKCTWKYTNYNIVNLKKKLSKIGLVEI